MDKKQRIIITMLELVVKQGVHATPMSQVAREANVAVGTIYHYFENKNQIIEEIYNMIYQDYGVVLMANLPNEGFQKQYEAMWLNLYNYFIGNPLAFQFVEFIGVPPIISKEVMDKTVVHFSSVRDFFLNGIIDKHLRDAPLRLVLQYAYGNVVSAVWLKTKGELDMEGDDLKTAIAMSWDCIKNQR